MSSSSSSCMKGDERRRLTDDPEIDRYPAISPDGKSIVFGGDPDNAGNWDLWMVEIKTLEVRRLTTDPASDGGPVFVPAKVVKSFLMEGR